MADAHFVSRHFDLTLLAPGIYAAIATNSGGADCNAGIIDLGDRTLIFDSFLTPEAAKDLYLAAQTVTGKPASFVVNSHYHNDHIRGNQVFPPETDIISTSTTRQLMMTAGVDELEWDRENAQLRLAAIKTEMETAPDSPSISQTAVWVNYFKVIVDSLPNLELRYPNLTFQNELTIHGTVRIARLVSYGPGHTQDDVFLCLPQEGITFLGDLLFVNCHPFLADGDPRALLASLQQIDRLNGQILVPGHGPIGNHTDLKLMLTYIETLLEMVQRAINDGGSADQAAALPIPELFRPWQFPFFYATNVRFIHRYLSLAT